MAEAPECAARPEKARRAFATTHWSIVRAAGGAESSETAAALEALCRTYWYPVYAHVRHWGYQPEDARDLTQEFFFRLLQSKAFGRADPTRGRFRSFMLASLKHFLRDAHASAHAQKRGGDTTIISWDQAAAEARLERAGVDGETPDLIFERRWAETVLEQAISRLRREYETSGRGKLFETIRTQQMADGENHESLAEAASRLGTTVSAMKSAGFRLRRRYHALIRDEVAQTVEDPADLDDELRHLLAVVLP